jgi:hypothetical protein
LREAKHLLEGGDGLDCFRWIPFVESPHTFVLFRQQQTKKRHAHPFFCFACLNEQDKNKRAFAGRIKVLHTNIKKTIRNEEFSVCVLDPPSPSNQKADK